MNDLPASASSTASTTWASFRDHVLSPALRLIERGVCVATRDLPDYGIAAIRTGQFIGKGKNIWESSFDVVEPADDGKAGP